jgi:hypothetical protein
MKTMEAEEDRRKALLKSFGDKTQETNTHNQ